VSLVVEGDAPTRDAKVFSAERDVGFVTSAAWSPRFGAIALAYLHRDFLEKGTKVEVETASGRSAAAVR
jgi:glycine cleavage system aminomethyltransferase T